jgi:anti-sigma B factor antagonist
MGAETALYLYVADCMLNPVRRILLTRGIVTATDGLEITVDHCEEGTLVCLNGRLGIDSSPALRDRLLAMLRGQSPEAVIVDLTEVSYIDASGIATLLEGLKIARNRGTTLALKGLHDRLLHLFEVTGVLPLFGTSGLRTAPSVSKVS